MDRARRVFEGTPRFQLVSALGAGGMGVVFEAVDRDDGSRIALKVLPNLGPASVVSFKTEFRSLRGIHHPNLVTMGELIEHDGQLFFTMELVRGVDILSYVRASPLHGHSSGTFVGFARADEPTAPKDIGSVRVRAATTECARPLESRLRDSFRQLANGLVALHRAAKVHRDVKPSNVLVTREGRAVLLDFGLVFDVARPTRLHDTPMGSASYVSPEQAAGQPATFASDWYSYGALLFEALTGRPPLIGSAREILAQKEIYDGEPPSRFALDVAPDLDCLCEALLRRRPEQRPRGEEVLAVLAPGETDRRSGASLAAVSAPFVGRARELRILDDAFRRTDDKPLVVAIDGESGVGKTALLSKFLAGVRSEPKDGAFVFYGRCSERERIPFQAFDEIANQMADVVSDPMRVGLLANTPAFVAAIRAAAVIFPAMAEAARHLPDDAKPPPDSVARRAIGFRGVRELLRLLARQSPVVVCIDDWQWADADSVALLAGILSRYAPPPVLVLLLSRDGGVKLGVAIEHLIVRNLDLADAERLATDWLAIAGMHPTRIQEAAASIASESTGHPLFVLELVQQVVTGGHDAQVPPRLDDALWARFSGLEPVAKNAVRLLVTARAPMFFSVFCDAMAHLGTPLEWSDRPGLMDRLRLDHFARFDGLGAADAVDCFHDRVATAILSRLPSDERTRCHGALAIALENAATLDFETLAAHWLGANEPDRAIDRAEAAGHRAMQGLAFERAAELYDFCLNLGPNEATARSVREKLGEALSHLGRSRDAAREYLAAAEGAPEEHRIALQSLAADQLFRSGHFETAVRLAEHVFESLGMPLPKGRWATRARLIGQRLRLRLRGARFRTRAATPVSQAALARVDAGWSVAIGLGMVDNFRGAYVQSRHLDMAIGLGEPFRILRAMALEVSYRATEGSRSRPGLDRWIIEAEALALEIGDPYAFGFTHLTRGIAAFLCGDWVEAKRACELAESIFENRPSLASWELATGRLFLLFSSFFLGDLRTLQHRVPELVREATARGDLVAAMNLRLSVCNAAWLVGDDPTEASRQLDEAEKICPRHGSYVPPYWCAIARANLCLYLGRPEEAHRRAVAVWPTLRRSMMLRMEHVRAEAYWLRGRCALARAASDRKGRDDLLREVVDCARRLERERVRWAKSVAGFLYAGVYALRGAGQTSDQYVGAAVRAAEAASLGLMTLLATGASPLPSTSAPGEQPSLLVQIVARPDRWRAMLLPGL